MARAGAAPLLGSWQQCRQGSRVKPQNAAMCMLLGSQHVWAHTKHMAMQQPAASLPLHAAGQVQELRQATCSPWLGQAGAGHFCRHTLK